jgi:2-furoyl-CoA dehydrogenase FAD binding subunit
MILGYHLPNTLDEALNLLTRTDVLTYPLGGGTVLSCQQQEDCEVVDIKHLGLSHVQKDDKSLKIGSATTLADLQAFEGLPLELRKAIGRESTHNMRQTASTAGALVTCDGRSVFGAAMLALDAQLVWEPGDVQVTFGDWLPVRSSWNKARLITSIKIPLQVELLLETVSRTPADLPIVCLAIGRWPGGRTRVVLAGHGDAPIVAMDGRDDDGAGVAAAEAYAHADDTWASAEYRQDVIRTLIKRMLD